MLIYLHIPYCDSKCHYCAFNSYTMGKEAASIYMKKILEQLKFDLKNFQVAKKEVKTLYIGGGTPSSISANLYYSFFKYITPYLSKNAEITIEANPNSATKEWLKEIKEFGVNRISFGVQSFNRYKLKILGRAHSKSEAIEAIYNAQKVGFKNISIDLIYGVRIDSKKLIENDLNIAINLPINHISTYDLIIERGTLFQKFPSIKKENLYLEKFLNNFLKEHNFFQYEVSNYGKKVSKHNLGYWCHKNYIGLGAGAVGFFKDQRYYPNSNIANYIKNPTSYKIEKLGPKDILYEKILLGLRSICGIRDYQSLPLNMQKRIELLIEEKRLTKRGNRIFTKEFFLADELALFIIG